MVTSSVFVEPNQLQLTLEAGLAQDDARLRPALEEALDATRRLHDTVEEVLRLAGSPGPPGAVAEILGVLLDNARTHGRGSVRVTVRDLDDALAFDVADEGTVTAEPEGLFARGRTGGGNGGTGIGLALARDLAVSLGGRLFLSGGDPTTFTLLVPVAPVAPATR
jgi:signal transduction histidine kinase